jgi:cell division protein FtsL
VKWPLSFSPRLAPVLIGCVVLVLLYLLVRFYHTSVESYRLEQRTEAVRQEIARLESDNQALATQVARARTDEYVELIARERLNMIRPGDRPLVMLREQPPAVPAQSLPAPAAAPQPQPVLAPSSPLAGFGHVGEWLNLFFGST